MKVIHLSNSDFNGGAAIAAKRIVIAQRQLLGVESNLLVQSRISKGDFIFTTQASSLDKLFTTYRKFADELSIRLLTIQSRGRFTFPYFGQDISKNTLIKNADVINLHWINNGFLSLNSLEKLSQLNKPIVWTLHDMWAITGGCHYSSGCTKFIDQCSDCPSLLFKSENDLSNKIFSRKKKILENLNLTIITCSKWLAGEALRSRLLSDKKIITIPNPLDTNLFKPFNKIKAKENFKFPLDKKIILIGAMNLKDERKGFRYLIEGLNIINNLKIKNKLNIELVVFGKLDQNVLSRIPFNVHQLGKLNNENEIVMSYNSADVYVAPSLEDNLPNTVMEAMACGVPVVAFNVGGIPDMVDDRVNGFLAKLKSSEELAKGIELILSDEDLQRRVSLAAREKVTKNFDQKIIAEKYLETYKSL